MHLIFNASVDSTRLIPLRKKVAHIESNVDRKVGNYFLSPKAVFEFILCYLFKLQLRVQ